MTEVPHANDTWIAGPLRDMLTEAHAGVADADAVLGALLAVLGRSTTGADPADAAEPRCVVHDRAVTGPAGVA